MGSRQSCSSNSKSLGCWYSLFWPGCLCKYVSWVQHVYTKQNLAQYSMNTIQKQWAICSVLVASALPAMMMSIGHCIKKVAELSLVAEDKVKDYKKTKEAVQLIKKLKAWNGINKVYVSQRMRTGNGKMRNQWLIQCRGTCIIYYEAHGIIKALRNIPAISLLNVSKLDILKVALGEPVGCLCICTESALQKLDDLNGSWLKAASLKSNTDLNRILKIPEIQRDL